MKDQVTVCKVDELPPGEITETTLGRLSVVVCRTLEGEFYAFANRCIHQGAPLSKGKLCGAPTPTDTVGEYNYDKEGEVLRCPWHGREFDVTNNGRMLSNSKLKLREFKVSVENNNVIVSK